MKTSNDRGTILDRKDYLVELDGQERIGNNDASIPTKGGAPFDHTASYSAVKQGSH